MQEFKEKAIAALGFDRLNAMQEQMLEVAASGQNTLLLSPTGSGKTVAFLLPLMAQTQAEGNCVRTLILVPSRELAQQIGEVSRKLGIRTVVCYGGHDIRIENDRLTALFGNLPQSYIIVSTAGRCKDHIEREHIDARLFTHLVLDEYDKSLELGFEEEMKFIVGKLSSLRQRILTSATHAMPIAPWIGMKPYAQVEHAQKDESYARKDEDYARKNKYTIVEGLKLWQVKSPVADKLETLKTLIGNLPDGESAIIFSNYRESSERIAHFLADNGIGSALYHGGLDQAYRDKALIRFRQQSVRVLVCTDLGSRGLDIPEVSHIVHYHLPADEETFTHRNGRTARAGATGNAYLILGPSEFVPEYISKEPPFFTHHGSPDTQNETPNTFETVYIGRGKKEKISKGDVVGFFTRNGGIDGSQIGRIDIMEHCAYCAIRSEVVHEVLRKVQGLKIKGEKTIYKVVESN